MRVEPVSDPDVALLQRIVVRDADAVAALYDRHSGLLFGVIMRILRNRPDAEEVLQEVFVRVWTRAESYDERLGCPAAWLTRMARNRAIDRLRARRARGETDAPEPADSAPAREERLVASDPTPERQAEDTQRTDRVRSALDGLPEEQRVLIAAAFFDGYTHSELAARFQLPLGTVKTRIRSGMLAMRQQLESVVDHSSQVTPGRADVAAPEPSPAFVAGSTLPVDTVQ
jgi:RNA polymerase sigma-70 factor (ECF subfamily)